jgi:small multidrug resistance pump
VRGVRHEQRIPSSLPVTGVWPPGGGRNAHLSQGWIFLIGAVVFEVLGTSMLKLSEQFSRLLPTAIAIIGYLLSLYLLSYALRTLPIAIAYGAWGAIGIVLITFIGVIFFKQVPDLPAIIGLFLIVSGVLIINLFSKMQIH